MQTVESIIYEVVGERTMDGEDRDRRDAIFEKVILKMKESGILPYEGGEVFFGDERREIADEKIIDEIKGIVREALKDQGAAFKGDEHI